MPLVGSTITPIVVFLPLITITGVTGTFAAGDTVDVLGAGPGGADILGAIVFGAGAQIVLSAPATVRARNTEQASASAPRHARPRHRVAAGRSDRRGVITVGPRSP